MVVALAAVTGGCASVTHDHASPATDSRAGASADAVTGTLTGQVVFVGGPPQTPPRPVARGVVTFAGLGQKTAGMSEHGRFSVELQPGTYTVTATSPDYLVDEPCRAARPVRVAAGETVSTKVFCQER